MCIVDSSLFAEKEPDMLTPFTVLMPANIRFGRGQALRLPPGWRSRAANSAGAWRQPAAGGVSAPSAGGAATGGHELAISREPWLIDIEQGVQLAREKGVRAVVSLGGGAVIDAGFDAVEIPLNSPQWEQSIPAIVDAYGDKALIGAGTVLKPEQVDAPPGWAVSSSLRPISIVK